MGLFYADNIGGVMRVISEIKHATLGLAFALSLVCFNQPVFAGDPQPEAQARAASLQTWREQCSDPDPDLRLAYVEAAIATKDASVQRICVRLALQSDNADIRNLGLRAAIASTPQITFMPTMPKSLEADLRKGADDENFMKKVKDSLTSKLYTVIQNGLKMCSDNAEVGKNSFLWNSLASNVELRKENASKAVIIGSNINWSGTVNSLYGSSLNCTINVTLTREGKLAGTLNCNDVAPMNIIADLL